MKKGPFILAVAVILLAIGFLIRSVVQAPGPSNPGNTVVVATIPPSVATHDPATSDVPSPRAIQWHSATNPSNASKLVVPGLKVSDLTIVGTNPPPTAPNVGIPGK